jgi:hypothetical protein
MPNNTGADMGMIASDPAGFPHFTPKSRVPDLSDALIMGVFAGWGEILR